MELAYKPPNLQPLYGQMIITIQLQNSINVVSFDHVNMKLKLKESEEERWGGVQGHREVHVLIKSGCDCGREA